MTAPARISHTPSPSQEGFQNAARESYTPVIPERAFAWGTTWGEVGDFSEDERERVAQRLFGRVEAGPNGCWVWTGGLTNGGYGSLSLYRGGGRVKTSRAHRLSYELVRGAIPSGLTIDHLCHNLTDCAGGPECIHRRCVNPWHLDPVTNAENQRRSRRNLRSGHGRETHCPQGHPYDDENTYQCKGRRYCRTCKRIHIAAWRSRQKQRSAA